MGMLPITIRKRTIAKADLELIQATVDEHWDKDPEPQRCDPSAYLGFVAPTMTNVTYSF
jgi:hypothetical protein